MDEQFDTTRTDEAFDALRGYALRTPLPPPSAVEARGRKRQKHRRTAATVASTALVATVAFAVPTLLGSEPTGPREVASAPGPDPALTRSPSAPDASPPSDDNTPGVGDHSFDPALLLNAEELPAVGRDWVMHQEQRGWDQMTRLNPCQRDVASYGDGEAVRADPAVALQLAAAQRLKHRDGQLRTRRENDQSCEPLAPSRLPDGSEPGEPRIEEDLVVWGTGSHQVAQRVGNPLGLTEDWASRSEYRGSEALFAAVGDPGQIAFFFAVGGCEYTTWVGPGVSVRDARAHFRTY